MRFTTVLESLVKVLEFLSPKSVTSGHYCNKGNTGLHGPISFSLLLRSCFLRRNCGWLRFSVTGQK